MRIAVDARMITHPGIGRYIASLLQAMTTCTDPGNLLLFGSRNDLAAFSGCTILDYGVEPYSWQGFLQNPFAAHRPDVVHIPHFTVPWRSIQPLVITIHDLIYLKFAQSSPWISRAALRPILRRALAAARRVIAVSEHTRRDIIEFYPGAAAKIRVVYEAAGPLFKVCDEKTKAEIRARYRLPDTMILCVSALKAHKNIERLIAAYTILKERGYRHRLVIVGNYRPREREILSRIRQTDAVYLGNIPSGDLVGLYNCADVFVHPSLYEGFGLTILEAMACGVPVACSRTSSLPEVAGDAACFFDPLKAGEMADVLSSLLDDGKLRKDLVQRGLAQVKRFSWRRAAEETLAIYTEALAQ